MAISLRSKRTEETIIGIMIEIKGRVANTHTVTRITITKEVTIINQTKCSQHLGIKICMVDSIMILAAIATMIIRVRPTEKKMNHHQTNDTTITIVKKA